MSLTLNEIHEEAHSLGATIMSDDTFVFKSVFSADKFLYRHKSNSAVNKRDDGTVVIKLREVPAFEA